VRAVASLVDAGPPPLALTPQRRARLLVVAGSVPPAVILGLMALLAGPLIAVLVTVAVGGALASWLWWGGERRVLTALAARPALPSDDARLLNLVDGLCAASGVRQPRVLISEDPGLNLLVAGRSTDRAILAVTSGLLSGLSRIELEGVLADGLVQIRRGDIVAATVAVATFGLAWRFAFDAGDHDAEVDRAGMALTRYPPALASAFETMDRLGTTVAGVAPSMAPLWLAHPGPRRSAPGAAPTDTGDAAATSALARPPLLARASLLREL